MSRFATHVLAVALLAAGCNRDSATGPLTSAAGSAMPIETVVEDPQFSGSMEGLVVATVPTVTGGIAEFIDVGDGHIAIGERAPRRARFVALPLVARGSSALEVLLALGGAGVQVPASLLRDHERVTQGAAPRTRNVIVPNADDLVAADLQTPGLEPYACDSFGTQWKADWVAAFAGITKYRAAAYAHNYAPPYTFYPGAPVYYGTNTNSITYLGACNGDEHDDLSLEIHRRINGTWVPLHQIVIAGYEKYTFYSAIPAAYRGRTSGVRGATVEHYGIGAAWTLSPREAIP